MTIHQILSDHRVAVVRELPQYRPTPPFNPSEQFPENRAFFYYDRNEFSIKSDPSRSIRYMAIADGLIGGEKESPLSPTPKKFGFVMAATNPVALDACIASLIGFDIYCIPQIYKAFSIEKYPLVSFKPEEIEILGLNSVKSIKDVFSKNMFVPFEPSCGWKGHIEYRAEEHK